MNRHRIHHGIFLVEMLFVIAMLSIVFVLEARLFSSSTRIINAMPEANARMAQINQMTESLGRDVWGAATIELIGTRAVSLVQPDGSNVRWDFNEDGRIVRSTDARQWTVLPAPLPQRVAGGLVLKTSSNLAEATDSRPLLSQMLVWTEQGK